MQKDLTNTEILAELEPIAEDGLNHHLSVAKEWHPHDYVPWDLGRNYAALGGDDWAPEQSRLSEVAKVAMVTNLLTEDNLPSYHRGAANLFSLDRAWGDWVNQWTAEENRHGIVIRDYLVVTRGVDPVALERMRMAHMRNGLDLNAEERENHAIGPLTIAAYATLQELATRVSHRNTGKICDDPIAESMLARVATDENLHMVFYRNLFAACLDLTPDQAMEAVCGIIEHFGMPGRGMPNWRRNSVIMAKHGIYDLRQHLEGVVMPCVKKWRIFERTDVSARGEQRREELATYLHDLEKQVIKFEEQRDRILAREAAKALA